MAKSNPNNAHVRRSSKRESPDVKAEEAQRLLDDPAFNRGFDSVREGCINLLENFKHDGSSESDEYERELCRTLRTLHSVKRAIALGVQGHKLRLADYKPQAPEQE